MAASSPQHPHLHHSPAIVTSQAGLPHSVLRQYTRLPLLVSVTLTAMVGLFYVASSTILSKNLELAEAQNAIQAVKGVQNVLSQTEEDFSCRFADWSSWDDAYAFARQPDSKFIESNLVPQALANLRVNLVLIVKPSGKIIYGTGFDPIRRVKTPIPQQLYQHLVPGDRLLQQPNAGENVSGLFMLGQKPMLITARPILTSEGQGPAQGVLIFGRYLDENELHRLTRITRLNLVLHPLISPSTAFAQEIHRELLTQQQSTLVQLHPEQFNAGFTVLKDVYQRSILLLEVQVPSETRQEGRLSFQQLTISLTIVGVLFGGLIVFLVHHLVQFLKQRQQLEAALHHETLHDHLTGLPNRKFLMMRLEQAIHQSRSTGNHSFAVLFIDLDHFKSINDTLGHLAGDQVLIETAKRLLNCLRSHDTCARLSGDEFAILVENLDDITQLNQITQRIQKELSLPLILQGKQVRIGASIGAMMGHNPEQRAEDIIQAADAAMYRAKARGRVRHAGSEQPAGNQTIRLF